MLNSSKNNENDNEKVDNEVENDVNFLFVLVTFNIYLDILWSWSIWKEIIMKFIYLMLDEGLANAVQSCHALVCATRLS